MNKKDLQLNDLCEYPMGQVGSLGKAIHIVIGKPENPKHYITITTDRKIEDGQLDMIDTLITRLKELREEILK